jgi:bifunctional non-homologous end joining protein LigD
VQSTAEAFSARARPGLGVSMPVRWDELSALTGGDHWNIVTGPAHLARLEADPWADYWHTPQSLDAAMRKLGFTPSRRRPARRAAVRPA